MAAACRVLWGTTRTTVWTGLHHAPSVPQTLSPPAMGPPPSATATSVSAYSDLFFLSLFMYYYSIGGGGGGGCCWKLDSWTLAKMKDGVVWLFTEMTTPVLRALRVLASKIGSRWLKSALVLTPLPHPEETAVPETAVLASTERWPKPASCLECSSGTYQLDIRWRELAAPSGNSLSVSTGNCSAGFYRKMT